MTLMHPRTTTTVSHAPRRDVLAPPEPAVAAVAAAPFDKALDKALERPSAASTMLGMPPATESRTPQAHVVQPAEAPNDDRELPAEPESHEELALAHDAERTTADEPADGPAKGDELPLSAETILALFAIAPPLMASPLPLKIDGESTAWVVVEQTDQIQPAVNGAAAPLVAIAATPTLGDRKGFAEQPRHESEAIALPADLIAESDPPSESEAITGIPLEVAAVEASEPAQAAAAEVEASGVVDPSEPLANVDALVSEAQAPAVTESGLSSPQAVQTLVVDPAIGAQQRPRNVYGALGERPNAGRGPLPLAFDTERLLNRVARAFNSAGERDGEIRLRLSPVELGSLRLEIQMQEGSLVARVEAETSAAQMAILESLPVLRERLADLGMRIERFDVDLMQRDAGHSSEGSPEQDRSQPQPAVVPRAPRLRTEEPAAGGTTSIAPPASGRLNVIV